MVMEINKSRGHHMSRGIDGFFSGYRFLRDLRNHAFVYADVRDLVESGLRVHDATVLDHEVVILAAGYCGKKNCSESEKKLKVGSHAMISAVAAVPPKQRVLANRVGERVGEIVPTVLPVSAIGTSMS
ncbi:hypothetical protein GCM10027217_25960 [Pseudomaricurvus hydrocarbonicus]